MTRFWSRYQCTKKQDTVLEHLEMLKDISRAKRTVNVLLFTYKLEKKICKNLSVIKDRYYKQ